VDATKPDALTWSVDAPADKPENENAPDASVVVVTGASATNIVTAADAIGFDVPAWSTRPANVPAGTVVAVVVVVADGAETLGLQAAVKDTTVSTARRLQSFSEGMITGAGALTSGTNGTKLVSEIRKLWVPASSRAPHRLRTKLPAAPQDSVHGGGGM